jgi:hypothetical protein
VGAPNHYDKSVIVAAQDPFYRKATLQYGFCC